MDRITIQGRILRIPLDARGGQLAAHVALARRLDRRQAGRITTGPRVDLRAAGLAVRPPAAPVRTRGRAAPIRPDRAAPQGHAAYVPTAHVTATARVTHIATARSQSSCLSIYLPRQDGRWQQPVRRARETPRWTAPVRAPYSPPLPIVVDTSGAYVPPPLALTADGRGPQAYPPPRNWRVRTQGLALELHGVRPPMQAITRGRVVRLPRLSLGIGDGAPRPSWPPIIIIVPVPGVRIVVPRLECFRMSLSAEIALIVPSQPDRPLWAESITIRWRWTDHVWDLSATVLGTRDLLDEIDAAGAGLDAPRLRVTVNGVEWVFWLTSYPSEEQYGGGSRPPLAISISGSSATFGLGDRYQTPLTYTEDEPRSVAQLAEEAVTPSGYSLSWTATDWLIPAGIFAAQRQRPIEIVQGLANVAGAHIIPHRTALSLEVAALYPTLPWDLAGITPEITVPLSSLSAVSRDVPPPVQANALYLLGGHANPTLWHAVRTGSAGDKLAEERHSELLTHGDGAQALAERVLAAAHPPPVIRAFTCPFDGGLFPLFEPGATIAVSGTADRGYVRDLTITVTRQGGAEGPLWITQRVGIWEDVTNMAQRLLALNAPGTVLVGTVTAVNGDQTLTVAMAGGGSLRVSPLGGESVGDRVYVRDLVVIGPAPSYGTAVELAV